MGTNGEGTDDEGRRPSEIMRALGIRQVGEPVLSEPAERFELPREAEDAQRIVAELIDRATLVSGVHRFEHGMGLSAPQLGVPRAAAVVIPPEDAPIVLLNPTVVDLSVETVDGYEGCLSFFDVRGLVPRPRAVDVEHFGRLGERRLTRFRFGMARLVLHEIDHLNGVLYESRMRLGARTISVEEYRQLVGGGER